MAQLEEIRFRNKAKVICLFLLKLNFVYFFYKDDEECIPFSYCGAENPDG